jgi:LacI family transcriptional regulator
MLSFPITITANKAQRLPEMDIKKRSTIKQVARAAGVSTQTVSRVINDRPDVAPETRERVQQVIDSLGYRPSALARSLIQQRTYTLGVVTAGLKYLGPSRTLNGITSKAEELGYALLLKELPRFDTNDIEPLLHTLLSRQVDGIVWAVPEVGDNRSWVTTGLAEIHIPFVFLTMQSNHPDLSIVSYDNYLGATIATEHLLKQGYRHIGHVSGPLDWWEARQRRQAWQDTLEKAGMEVTEDHWSEGNWSPSSGEAAFEQLLETYPEMDAVFAANDQMALSVLQIAHRRGICIPHSLAVVGFDDITESAYFWPPLTTINQNQYELGCWAVQEVVSHIEASRREEKIQAQSISLVPELIIRESSVIQ